MKKLLLSTVAAFAVTGAANAATFDLNVGGFVDAQAGYADIDNRVEQDQIGLQTDAEIHVTVEGQSNGLGYGAVVELEADASLDSENRDINSDKTYLFLQGDFGRVEIGTNTDASDALDVNTGNFARATGGVDGDFNDFARTGATGTNYIRPDGPSAQDRGVAEDANKITYYTQRNGGVQVGISYAPQGLSVGQDLSGLGGATLTDVVTGGINYTGNWDGFGIAASATAETGNSQAGAEDMAAQKYGLSINSGGVTVGGSYGIIDEDVPASGMRDGTYFDAGIAVENGPFGASVTYFSSNVEGAATEWDFTNIVVGADYVYAPGAAAYAEVSIFEAENSSATTDEGTIVMVGTQLGF